MHLAFGWLQIFQRQSKVLSTNVFIYLMRLKTAGLELSVGPGLSLVAPSKVFKYF